MSAEPNSVAPLTAEEIAEIAEYERIVKFAEDIVAGRHPRIKIDVSLLANCPLSGPPAIASPLPATAPIPSYISNAPAVKIDYGVNYYKVLGLQSGVKHDSILRGYKHKKEQFGPNSEVGRANRQAGGLNASHAEGTWRKIRKAY
ncbi:uncharacterized protein LY89DRAFT_776653 [Mollisia scopiformis]|uniref:Uncharacterized protein n=1 Tax=Mollisia scopiformis TaxID=149040 RepID=A0A194XXL4_MOLSC|nr:uncharacterized protein LY89DRAFT_776653 [Mollisia scopiformis]KUJ24567.1 hypothetical protein LY89DRAFT_776653 [Mollisia scopiformis]